MKSWKSRLLMVLTTLAVVLAVSVPALADDMEVKCGGDGGACTLKCANDGEFCTARLDSSSDQSGEVDSVPPEDAADPVSLSEDCFPFCGVEWPW
jgi:hypothetical protein